MASQPRVALLADIHGNARALEAVLANAHEDGLEEFVIAGDSVMNGPEPTETLTLIRNLSMPTLVGNTGLEVIRSNGPVATWTRHQLDPEELAYLASLSLAHRVTPPGGNSCDDLLVFHASPRNCYDVMILEPHPMGTTFTTPTTENDILEMLTGATAGLMVFGHIHYPSSRTVREHRLASIGSVDFPFDGDTRAAYAVAEWNGESWRLEHRRVS